MGWLDIFRKPKCDDPPQHYEDDELGSMLWSPDDEAWAGEHEGIPFRIAYTRRSTPADDLLAYARAMLADSATLLGAIDRAKPAAIAENPRLADEVAGLRVECVRFFTHNGVRRILADLEGGKRDRSWRVEFQETECEGIGFDT